MVRCKRPLTTYPARANRSKTLFWAICVAVEDTAWSDMQGAPNRADHTIDRSGVPGLRGYPALVIGCGPCLPREVPLGVSRVSDCSRDVSLRDCVSGSIL